jgi:predicted kinase
MDYYNKYLLYKKKYLDLHYSSIGGSSATMAIPSTSKKLYISFGVPGSGKTSRLGKFAEEIGLESECIFKSELRDLASNKTMATHEADNYKPLYERGFNPRLLGDAHKWCQSNLEAEMAAGHSHVFQSNTNLNPRDMIPYLDMAIKYGYEVIIVLPSEGSLLHYPTELTYSDQVRKVIENRNGSKPGEKVIPREQMIRMIGTFETNISKLRSLLKSLDLHQTNPSKLKEQISINF